MNNFGQICFSNLHSSQETENEAVVEVDLDPETKEQEATNSADQVETSEKQEERKEGVMARPRRSKSGLKLSKLGMYKEVLHFIQRERSV